MAGITIVIPARNEERTIGQVVRTAVNAAVGNVIVVNDCSTDQTAAIARASGATVVNGPGIGKGEAMRAGLENVGTPRVMFLDADTTGLTVTQIRKLARDNGGMIIGYRDYGELPVASFWPPISGDRALPTATALRADLKGYGAEMALNAQAGKEHLPVNHVKLSGVTGKFRAGPLRWIDVAPHFIRHMPGLVIYMTHGSSPME